MHFYKYQGTGNDFVIVDNREGKYHELSQETIHKICDRRFGVGGDGFMLLNNKEGYDFEMVYYNADGRLGTMCGNGGRCIVKFAYDMGIRRSEYKFWAVDGEHIATIQKGIVSLKMSNVSTIQQFEDHVILNTGSPHYVKQVTNLKEMNVFEEGRKIRYSDTFKKEGINVNFVEPINNHSLRVRTYERGVEDETYACGTGAAAVALAFSREEPGKNSIDLEVLGGKLQVNYTKNEDGTFSDIWLKGPAEKVFEGTIDI